MFWNYFKFTATVSVIARSTWEIKATNMDPSNYFGIIVSDGMIDLISSPYPMQVKGIRTQWYL